MSSQPPACPKAQCDLLAGSLDELLSREFLLTNGLGSYCSSSVVGTHTRKYHGLFVRAQQPPIDRHVMLNTILKRVWIDSGCTELGTFEFNNTFHPHGYTYLTSAWRHNEGDASSFCRLFVTDLFECRTVLSMYRGVDGMRVDIRLRPKEQAKSLPLQLDVLTFCSLRDFHALRRRRAQSPLWFNRHDGGIVVRDAWNPNASLCIEAVGGQFVPQEDWWFNFRYREELARGHDGHEDQYVPGYFTTKGAGGLSMTLFVGTQPDQMPIKQTALPPIADIGPKVAPKVDLTHAADQFVCDRRFPDVMGKTILAGYHWFADWGRDSFIAMPGLLLETGRYAEAKSLLTTFARVQKDGLIPNRFDDYGNDASYNSVDASLWYGVAAERYTRAANDPQIWAGPIGSAVRQIIEHFHKGTQFDIFVDQDGLVSAGNAYTQLTWMDAKCGGTVFTPRHGKAVEINALWHLVLTYAATRFAEIDAEFATFCSLAADKARESFSAFWYELGGYCYDVINGQFADTAIRPNMLIACLSDGLLTTDQSRRLLAVVRQHLVTPFGLRSLSPSDPQYVGRYEGSMYQRDSSYHQGTVWAWWIGPYVEAVLNCDGQQQERRSHVAGLLGSLREHARVQAGIGSVSEIFDGDPPYTPKGCIAQGWSVGELLRAERLLAAAENSANAASPATTNTKPATK